MTTKTKTVRAAAYAPDGTEITYTSPPNKWDVAGIARNSHGQWAELAHGGSYDSVRSRAITQAYRRYGYDRTSVTAVRIYEATAPVVREYFGHHKVSIYGIFRKGRWESASLHGGWSNIRKLSLQGATALAIGPNKHRVADFQIGELLKSMHLPPQRKCATRGHEHLPAVHKAAYRYTDGPDKTEYMCQACLDILHGGEDAGVVASLSAIPLAR